MSLFRDSLRPPPLASDAAVRRYLELIRAELEPDPLFRRRLRGTVVNRFVAAREGLVEPARRGSAMGKLGRAVLYASFTLALSVTSVMAASQQALPGDLLYPLKLRIEALRLDVLPEHLHDDLIAMNIAERLGELNQLMEAGRQDLAAPLISAIGDDYALLAGADPAGTAAAGGSLDDRLVVIEAMVDQLPASAQSAVEAVFEDAAPGLGNNGGTNNDGTNPNDSFNNGGLNNDGTNGGAAAPPPPDRETPAGLEREPATLRPAHSPRAEFAPTPMPEPEVNTAD